MRVVQTAAVVLATAIVLGPAEASDTELARISVGVAGQEANGPSGPAAISGDSTVIAFQSAASNLVAGDDNATSDVFVYDAVAHSIELVSKDGAGAAANGASFAPAVSDDGRFVAFHSSASNLVAGDTNGVADIFVHDRVTRKTTRASLSAGGAQADGASLNAALSADGRYVAFESLASNLVPVDVNATADVFVRDMVSGTLEMVSVGTLGQPGNGWSETPALSADGRYVAFKSTASTLAPLDVNGAFDIFLRDRVERTTTLVSVSTDGIQGIGASLYPSISADGRYVAFESVAFNLVDGDTNNSWDIFVHDRVKATTTRASVSAVGGEANGHSGKAAISGDGRFVAYESSASNLSEGSFNTSLNIFVFDRVTGRTTSVSENSAGLGNGPAFEPAISFDGTSVVFHSEATNLVADDANMSADIFSWRAALSAPNRAPVLDPLEDVTVCIGDEVVYRVRASDPDGSPYIAYSAERLPRGARFDRESGIFSWIPAPDQAGTWRISFAAADALDMRDLRAVAVAVEDLGVSLGCRL